MFWSPGSNERGWFNAVYITDNFIAFTTDHANSAAHPGYKNIIFVIAKTNDNDICVVPDLALDNATYNNYYNPAISGCVAIHYNTELIIPIPTKDNDYSQTDRIGKRTILAPAICNDANRRIVKDVYAVISKEHPSYCDVLTVDDHHFLTNGRIACKLD